MDLSACDREPIHISGAIQPHGVLLALDPEHMTVVQVAGDTMALLGVPPEALLGQSLEARLGSVAATKLCRLIDKAIIIPRPLLVFETSIGDSTMALDGVVHISEGLIIIELEPQRSGFEREPLALVQRMIANCTATETISQFLASVAEEVFRATGFARVMVYQFLQDGSGSVIAESRAEGVDSFLGLRYPASDVPQQARRLYVANWLRLIPDVDYTPAPLIPADNPKTGRPLDLSHSVLRSVSPIHVQYLKNMGVQASMSMSIVIDGELWGLIACHDYSPHFLDTRLRAACELFSQVVSLQLQEKIASELARERVKAGEIERAIVTSMARKGFNDALISSPPNLLDLIPANGCAIFVDEKLTSIGDVPSEKQIMSLIHWLDANGQDGVFVSESLAALFAPAEDFRQVGSGVLAISVSRTPRDYVIWFRPEVTEIVKWAGNPEKPVQPSSDGETLSPRASFTAWEQMVRLKSEPWTGREVESAKALRTSIMEVILRTLDEALRERHAAKARQDMLMAELDHRVKNTIAVIQSLVRFTSRSAASLEAFQEDLQNRLFSMARMQTLLTESRWEGVSIKTLVESELETLPSDCCRVTGDPVVLKPKAALAISLAIHELATNAQKYGSLSIPGGLVSIDWGAEENSPAESFVITWKESGGPRVTPPTKKGFGRVLLGKAIALDLQGAVELTFDPEGVQCRLSMPLTQIARRDEPLDKKKGVHVAPATLAACDNARVLVVEDSGLVALNVCELLRMHKMIPVGPFGMIRESLRALDVENFDVALLDIDLNGEPAWPIADALKDAGRPFVFTTAYDTDMLIPARFAAIPVVNKPYSDQRLLETLSKALTPTPGN